MIITNAKSSDFQLFLGCSIGPKITLPKKAVIKVHRHMFRLQSAQISQVMLRLVSQKIRMGRKFEVEISHVLQIVFMIGCFTANYRICQRRFDDLYMSAFDYNEHGRVIELSMLR